MKKSSKIEENLWTTCGCKNLIYKEDLQSNLNVVQNAELIINYRAKKDLKLFDNKEYELQTPLPKDDPLKFEE